jgi:putative peptidoglycan lipid II flippase
MFMVFLFSLVFWAIQGLYARAFFAAGDMWRPMIAGTLITVASVPLYGVLERRFGVLGLVLASNLAIFTHTIVLAFMLQVRGMVSIGRLHLRELAKAIVAAAIAGALGYYAGHILPFDGSRISAIANIGFVSITWLAAALGVLALTRAQLLRHLRR